MKTLLTRRFDLAGSEISRIIRILMFNRLIPVGNLASGGGVRSLFVLAILHLLGRPIFWLLIKQERRVDALHKMVNRLKR
jgi:hypothetical protein